MSLLRAYPRYRDSGTAWMGDVPEHWTVSRFGYSAIINTGQVDPRDEPWRKAVLVAPNHIESNTGRLIARETASDQGADSGKYLAYSGQILYSKIRPELNKVTVAVEDCLCSADMYAISFQNRIEPRYALYQMLARPLHQYASVTSSRVKMPKVNREELSAAPWVTPPMAEQRVIAGYLDHETAQIDALIRRQERLIETLRERRTAVVARAVTKGVGSGADLVESGVDWLGAVPRHWEIKRLKYSVASTQTGVWGEEPTGDADDVQCVRVADFDRPSLRVVDQVPTIRSVRLSDRLPRLLLTGDLLLEKSGGTGLNPVGFVAIFHGANAPAVSSNFITRLRLANSQLPKFWLYAHAASYATKLTARSVKQTTGIQNLDQARYFDELFPFPPEDEQQRIVSYLDEQTWKIDNLISKAERFVELAKERRSALVTAAVTGQIDLRGDAA